MYVCMFVCDCSNSQLLQSTLRFWFIHIFNPCRLPAHESLPLFLLLCTISPNSSTLVRSVCTSSHIPIFYQKNICKWEVFILLFLHDGNREAECYNINKISIRNMNHNLFLSANPGIVLTQILIVTIHCRSAPY